MRFADVRDLTKLPADQVESTFQRERVLTVLPVRDPGSGHYTILVATPTKLGLATLADGATDEAQSSDAGRWVTRWAPWDAVKLGSRTMSRSPRRGSPLRGAIRVGGRTFHGLLGGRPGRLALQEFSTTLRGRREALSLPGAAG